MVTVIFAMHAVGVVASLFLAGHVSDWLGRRRILAIAVGVNIASGVIFLTWTAVPGLLVARFISGISVGMLTAAATAHLTELHASARPAASRARADIVATAANLGGIGLGPLVSGLLAQYAGDALQIPYLVSEALMLLGVAALAGLFLAGYVGLAVPMVGLGVAVQMLSARAALVGFAAALIAVVAVVSRRLIRPAPAIS